MRKKQSGVYKVARLTYIRSGSYYSAVPQAARTSSAVYFQILALARNFAGRLLEPRGTRSCVPNFDEEGGAHAHAA